MLLNTSCEVFGLSPAVVETSSEAVIIAGWSVALDIWFGHPVYVSKLFWEGVLYDTSILD